MVLSSGALALALAGVAFLAVPGSPPVVIDTWGDPVEVATGVGWAVHPDTTDDELVQFVEGPATPPLGRGSLLLSAPEFDDLALAFTVATGAPEPGGVLPTLVPWTGLSASYATFVPDVANPTGQEPTLRIVGYQVREGLEGFTTLSFQPAQNGPIEGGVWQTWDIGPDSEVFQSNATTGFCTITSRCTLAEFVAEYDTGGWWQVQVGLGTGVPPGSLGYADAVVVRDGTTAEYSYDFEVPADVASTATITQGAASATGGSATVTLTASADSATPTVPFTITVTLPDGTVQTEVVEVDAGTSLDVTIPVPFGVTHIEVSAQSTVIAEGDVTFTAPVAPVTPPVTPPVTGGAELPATGFDPVATVWGSALLTAGLALFAVGRVRARSARVPGGNLID